MPPVQRLAIFCASSLGARDDFADGARALVAELARRGMGVVYGGASVGLMGVVADAALAAGLEVIGVIPRAIEAREVAHRGLTELHVVDSMHTRKATMAELADGFLALPGGFGTLEEIAEVLTWAQLGLHEKPCGALDVAGYFTPLVAYFDNAVAEGLLRPEHRAMFLVDRDPARLLDAFTTWQAPAVSKWIDRGET
jgi:uncharacterized protein (TIGR00730 family)